MIRALSLILSLLSGAAAADPMRYGLEPEASRVGFTVPFGPDRITGTMPVRSADITLDFDRAANSRISVAVDAAGAKASFPFASQAMRGPKVLATATFPDITYVSRTVTPIAGGARIGGDITIRGVTRPLELIARIYRQQGTEEGDLSRLSVLLSGEVSRSAFGADGWSDMVGDTVTLYILARIARVP